MADALSLLRQFIIENKEYTIENDRFVFNDLAYAKDIKTNYLVYGTGKDSTPKDYYTLESIVFLLKNVDLQHANYVKKAAEKGILSISRPDRKDLLSYLNGQTITADRIDRNAPLEITMQRPLQVNKRPAEDPRLDGAKIARVEDDDMQKLKDRREKKFDEKNKEITADQIRPLSGELSTEAILKLRAKFRATARDKIVDFKENEDTPEPSTEPLPITADTFEIMKRERTWRNRTTVLQSSNKVMKFLLDFLKFIFCSK
jgi:parafibromin